MEKTKIGEIEVINYRSPEDDILVIFVDTPGVDENEKGPLMRLYLNDDPVFENPPYPGPKHDNHPHIIEPLQRFAELSWGIEDVKALEDWDSDWDDDAAREFLRKHSNQIQEQLCCKGWEIMEQLLNSWKPEKEDE